jgi:hypothetical protein
VGCSSGFWNGCADVGINATETLHISKPTGGWVSLIFEWPWEQAPWDRVDRVVKLLRARGWYARPYNRPRIGRKRITIRLHRVGEKHRPGIAAQARRALTTLWKTPQAQLDQQLVRVRAKATRAKIATLAQEKHAHAQHQGNRRQPAHLRAPQR